MNLFKFKKVKLGLYQAVRRSDESVLGLITKKGSIWTAEVDGYDHTFYTRDDAGKSLFYKQAIDDGLKLFDDNRKQLNTTPREALKRLINAQELHALYCSESHLFLSSSSNWQRNTNINDGIAAIIDSDINSARTLGIAGTTLNVYYVPKSPDIYYSISNYRPECEHKFLFSIVYDDFMHAQMGALKFKR